VLVVMCAVVLPAGCQVDSEKVRREHAAAYSSELETKTAAALGGQESLGLEACIRIALENNLDVASVRISRRLAGLDRKIAFSNFLPLVDAGCTHYASSKQQAIGLGGRFQSTSDRTINETTVSVQEGILAPETWFLYEAYVRGEDISKLVERRTRDMIRLQVTMLYYSCLSQAEYEKVLASSVEQSRALEKEVEALVREGVAMASQLEGVRALVRAQESDLAGNQRSQRKTRAALLEAMGLSPAGEIALKRETPTVVKEEELADQILYAMLNRPELYVADRTIEVRKAETKIAIAQFLPKLSGFADYTHSSNSYLKYSNLWTLGVSSVLTVFDGFKNVAEYEAAREREKQAGVDRERACLQIMLEVIEARLQYDQAVEQQKVAEQDLAASETLLKETEAKWREGLLMSSERLEATTRHAGAVANVSVAAFQTEVTSAALKNVMGDSPEGVDREESK